MLLTEVTGFDPILADPTRIFYCDVRQSGVGNVTFPGAVAKLGGELRRLSFSFPDGRCGWALSSRLAPESQRP